MTDKSDRQRIVQAAEANDWDITKGFANRYLFTKDGHPRVLVLFGVTGASVAHAEIRGRDGTLTTHQTDDLIDTLKAPTHD